MICLLSSCSCSCSEAAITLSGSLPVHYPCSHHPCSRFPLESPISAICGRGTNGRARIVVGKGDKRNVCGGCRIFNSFCSSLLVMVPYNGGTVCLFLTDSGLWSIN
ncbi:hypothetical protein BC827DRAFT_1245505 [Russula dissimulans]|nr:hypothetical protein BC827DRAFT_1245505 [Russula dissimulans]